MSGEQKYKENDALSQSFETTNRAEVLFFTNRQQCYKARLHEFDDTKASVLGDYLPSRLSMDEGENVVFMCLAGDYSGSLVFFFENGKAARVELSAYKTVSNRRKLTGAYSDKTPLVRAVLLEAETELVLYASCGRVLIMNTAAITPKTTRSSQGVAVMAVKAKHKLTRVETLEASGIVNPARYRTKNLPAAGAMLRPEDVGQTQMRLDGDSFGV
jgi:DNA gyrase subunit A